MFRFTIRELLLLTLVAALAIGWWIDRSQLVADFAAAKNCELEAADGKTYALEAVLAKEGFKAHFDRWLVVRRSARLVCRVLNGLRCR